MSIREAEYHGVSQRAKLASEKLMRDRIQVNVDLDDDAEFDGAALQRPTREGTQTESKRFTGKPQADFGSRRQINIDENDDTFQSQSELQDILKRGERLQQ